MRGVYGINITGACQNAAFCPVGSSTVTWQVYSATGSCDNDKLNFNGSAFVLGSNPSTTRADTGVVTLIQRFGSAANLNIHLHCLVLDGVYLNRDGVPLFHEAAAPSSDELEAVLLKIITRTMRILTRLGALIEEPERTYLAETDTDGALRSLQAASCTYRVALGPRAGQKVLSLQSLPSAARASTPELRVNAHGFSLHAAVRWGADQRKKLEHLCRYITRPAIANERLKRNRAGQVVLQLKSAFKDGTTHIVMSPLEFMQRLAALVPRPRLHLIRFHGVLAPNAKLRRDRPQSARASNRARMRSRAGRAGAPELGQAAQTGLRHRHRTLPELRRQLEDHRRPFDALRTGIEDPPVIVKILAHLGLPSRAPPRSPCAAIRSIPDNLRSPKPVANASRRRDPAHFARLRPLRRPSRPKQHRDFHQTERRLTSHPVRRYCSGQKKRWFKIPIQNSNH
jgi:Putative transposase